MGSLKFSVRQRIMAVTLFIAGTIAAPAHLIGQDQAPGAAANATKPIAVATLGSLDKLIADVQYIAGTVGQAQAGGMFSMAVGMYSQGIDMSRPIGVMLPLVNGMPEPIGFVPTADAKSVLKRVEQMMGIPADELDDGTMALAFGATTLYVKQVGQWAVLSRDRDLLKMAPADPAAAFEGLGNDYDLAVRLRVQEVPVDIRNMLIGQMRQGFEQAMSEQNPDADAAREMADSTMSQLEQLIPRGR